MVLPSRFREELGQNVVASYCIHIPTVTIDRCVAVYPMDEWESLLAKLDEMPSENDDMRYLGKVLLGNASEQEVDSAGRITVPQPLRNSVKIVNDVIISGQRNHLEIWDSSTWNSFNSDELSKYMVDKWRKDGP
jgi:MraZ protein